MNRKKPNRSGTMEWSGQTYKSLIDRYLITRLAMETETEANGAMPLSLCLLSCLLHRRREGVDDMVYAKLGQRKVE